MHDLPAAPKGRSGWPWTEACPRLPDSPPGGGDWPKISLVTPSFNQGRFIEETIRTVLGQGYPNLEYIIIDGGSTDESVEIIRKYEPWLAHWVSEADDGQSDAINKGFAAATGEVFGWLCSDDVLLPGALAAVGGYFAAHDDCRWLAGRAEYEFIETGETGRTPAGACSPNALIQFWKYGAPGHSMPQPSIFWHRQLWGAAGGLREEHHLAMDYDMWLRFEERARLDVTESVLSCLRLYGDCKSVSSKQAQVREVMQCAYSAAGRRGTGRLRLTLGLLAWELRRRAELLRTHVGGRWWGGVLRQIVGLPMVAVRVCTENGRMKLLKNM